MKTTSKLYGLAAAAVLAIAGGMGLTGCDGLGARVTEKSAADIQHKEYAAQTETGKVFQDLLALTVKAVSDSAQTTAEYDSGAANYLKARSAQSEDSVDLYDLVSRADLTKTRPGAERSMEGVEQTTLEDALNAISKEYEKNVAAFVPDLSFLEGVGYAKVEDGLVILDDDMIIDPFSMAGIIQLGLIKAQIAGEDVEAIIADMEQAAAVYGGKEEKDRGVYKLGTNRWPSKTVYYAWGTVSEKSKKLFQEAMADWSSKVPGLKFVDKTNDAGYKNAASLGQKPLVILESDPNLVPLGNATIGATYGKHTCAIRDELSGVWATRTPRHELGHTLGLNHEHQRWDRDTYLYFDASVKDDKTNWELIPWGIIRTTYGFYWDYFTVNVLFIGKVRIYYLVYGKIKEETIQKADGSGILDFTSIMLYSSSQITSLKVKLPRIGFPVGSPIPINYAISAGDIATVKKMYP
jgi:hypothetical protein